jgi:nitrous oxidase accessory protein NosD
MSGGGAGGRPMIHIQGMVNTVVQGCLLDGDAGSTVLQVVGGEVLVDGGIVTAGRLALTQAKATVKGVLMRGGTRKAGSAGMVLEGTRARLEGVTWSRCTEVALTLDQASQALVLKGRFEGNGTGISVLGGSQVHVEECRFTDQGTVYVVNSSGSTRGSSRLFLYTNEYQDNGKDRQVDERSMVQEGLRSSEALRSGATFIP